MRIRYQCFFKYMHPGQSRPSLVSFHESSTSATAYSLFRQRNRSGRPGSPRAIAPVSKVPSSGFRASLTSRSPIVEQGFALAGPQACRLCRAKCESVSVDSTQAPRRKRKWVRRLLIAAAVVALLPLLLLAHPRARAALRLTPSFEPLAEDPRVYYEPGAEGYAGMIAEALPGAVERVEACHGRPFTDEFRVYVCASHESFGRHLRSDPAAPVRGMALYRDVWLSPKALDFHGLDTHREAIAHELSHLHVDQHLGVWRRSKNLPIWFVEGLADWTSGIGFEVVSREEAAEALRSGPRLEPDSSGPGLRLKAGQNYGITWPMMHHQSRLFVEYLVDADKEAFAEFVEAVLDGAEFDGAFTEHLGGSLEERWGEFVEETTGIAGGSGAQPPAAASAP